MPPKKDSGSASSSFNLVSFFKRAAKENGDGKPKQPPKVGSEGNPLVISEDEDGEPQSTPRKRRKLSRTESTLRALSKEDNDIVAIDMSPSPPAPHSSECMICQEELSSDTEQAEAHVNACLDTPPSETKSKPPKPPPKEDSQRPSRNSQPPQPITSISHTLAAPPDKPDTSVPAGKSNAFSVLMSSHKEKELWSDVDVQRNIGRRRAAPFYKVLTGMPIAVDAFCYGAVPGINAYFLTHAHSDHYTNLSKSWKHGPIYCSITTANLIVLMLGVDPQWVHGLPDDVPFEIPNTGGVTVTLIEANHCPGSSLFLFEGRQTAHAGDSPIRSPYVGSKRVFRYLHCGDFRACPKHILHPAVAKGKLDIVYLDTTYLNPSYCFPPQPLVIQACAELAAKVAGGIDVKVEDVKSEPEEGQTEFEQQDADQESIDALSEALGPGTPTEEDVKPCLGHLVESSMLQPDLERDLRRSQEDKTANGYVGQDRSLTKPDIDSKPDIEDLKPDIEDVKPNLDSFFISDRKPGVIDTKPEVKPHPSTLAYEAQERSVAMMSSWLGRKEGASEEQPKGRVLVLIGTYSIGKERIVKAIANALGSKIYCNERKRGLLRAQDDPELHAMISDDPKEAQVHLLPLGNIQLDQLSPYLHALKPHFDRVLAFRPTGWTYTPPAGTNTLPDVNFVIKRDQARGFSDVSLKPIRGSCRQFMMFGVPYSEHSSFFELTCFSLSTPGDPKIIATVNVHSEKSRAKMKKWFEKWQHEKNRRKERGQAAIVEYRDETYVSYQFLQIADVQW